MEVANESESESEIHNVDAHKHMDSVYLFATFSDILNRLTVDLVQLINLYFLSNNLNLANQLEINLNFSCQQTIMFLTKQDERIVFNL